MIITEIEKKNYLNTGRIIYAITFLKAKITISQFLNPFQNQKISFEK